MAITLSYDAAAEMLTGLKTFIDSGTAAVIEIYTAAFGTKLATLTMSATAFGAVSDANPGAIMTAAAITADSSADATGTAAVFRMLTQSGGTTILEGTVGTSGADINFNTVAFVAASTIEISSLTITMPESA